MAGSFGNRITAPILWRRMEILKAMEWRLWEIGNMLFVVLVLGLIFVVNAGYGGGFSNVPTLLSDYYGMGSISALHGITLSAWAFAGLTGNQVANLIVNSTGEFITDSHGNSINPIGYQNVLYLTIVLYIVALLMSIFLVRPMDKDAKTK